MMLLFWLLGKKASDGVVVKAVNCSHSVSKMEAVKRGHHLGQGQQVMSGPSMVLLPTAASIPAGEEELRAPCGLQRQ